MFLFSPYKVMNLQIKVLCGLVRFFPINSIRSLTSLGNKLACTYTGVIPFMRDNFTSALGTPDHLAEEMAKNYYKSSMRGCIAETVLAKASPARVKQFRSKLRLISTDGAELESIDVANQNIVVAVFHFSSMFNLMWSIDKLLPRDMPLHCIASTDLRLWRETQMWRRFAQTREAYLWSLERPGDLKECLKMCRKTPSIVVCYSDLPGKFGPTQECRFMGRQARLNAGFVRLRKILKGRLIVGYARGSVFDKLPAEFTLLRDYPAGENVYMPDIADLLGREVAKYPLDWRNWHMFMSYFQPSQLARK